MYLYPAESIKPSKQNYVAAGSLFIVLAYVIFLKVSLTVLGHDFKTEELTKRMKLKIKRRFFRRKIPQHSSSSSCRFALSLSEENFTFDGDIFTLGYAG